MDQGVTLLRDMAVIMVIAGVVTAIFHRLRQPLILGYLVAGIVVGPYTPPFSFVEDLSTVRFFADLGVVLLLFSAGLEFPLRRLKKVGAVGFVAGSLKVLVPATLGFFVGRIFGLTPIESLYIGSSIAITSTAVVFKIIRELGLTNAPHTPLLFGICVVDDFIAVGLLVVLASIPSGPVDALGITVMLGKLVFTTLVLVIAGLGFVPKLVNYLFEKYTQETLLIITIGLCFAFALLTQYIGLSTATGAFLMGTIMGESAHRLQISKMVAPLRDVFAAIFFVAIGMLIDLRLVPHYLPLILALSAVAIVGKTIGAFAGTFLTGVNPSTGLKVGLSLAAIGEFSFIMARTGQDTGAVGDFLYPTIIGTALVTILFAPYMMKGSDALQSVLVKATPGVFRSYMGYMAYWFAHIRGSTRRKGPLAASSRTLLLRVSTNLLIVGFFMVSGQILLTYLPRTPLVDRIPDAFESGLLFFLVSVAVIILSVPCGITIVRSVRKFVDDVADGAAAKRNGEMSPWKRRVAKDMLGNVLTTIVLLIIALEALPLISVLEDLWYVPFLTMVSILLLVLVYLFRRSIGTVHANLERLIHDTIAGSDGRDAPGGGEVDEGP